MSSTNNLRKITGFSGNEIFCLDQLGYRSGQLCLGNAVVALGVFGGFNASYSVLAGGEVIEVTQLVHDARQHAFDRMFEEAKKFGGIGLADISFELLNIGGNLECIATCSTIHTKANSTASEPLSFSTSANAQGLYCLKDAGFDPQGFVFSNVAYSIGIRGNLKGILRGLKRGEVPHYTEIFYRTRHLALERIKNEAKKFNANAVIGIETSIVPLLGAQEMVMLGTASNHPALEDYINDPVTCALTNEELWNVVNLGYMPIQLLIGVSVYALGITSGVRAFMRSLVGGQVQTLTDLLYEAREQALERLQEDAEACGADEVIGVKTRVYDLGSGLVEFMVIGTAVKKMSNVTTKQTHLLPQALIRDRDTFVESARTTGFDLQNTKIVSAGKTQFGPIAFVVGVLWIVISVLLVLSGIYKR